MSDEDKIEAAVFRRLLAHLDRAAERFGKGILTLGCAAKDKRRNDQDP